MSKYKMSSLLTTGNAVAAFAKVAMADQLGRGLTNFLLTKEATTAISAARKFLSRGASPKSFFTWGRKQGWSFEDMKIALTRVSKNPQGTGSNKKMLSDAWKAVLNEKSTNPIKKIKIGKKSIDAALKERKIVKNVAKRTRRGPVSKDSYISNTKTRSTTPVKQPKKTVSSTRKDIKDIGRGLWDEVKYVAKSRRGQIGFGVGVGGTLTAGALLRD